MNKPPEKTVSRRNFVIGSALTGVTLATGAVGGYIAGNDMGMNATADTPANVPPTEALAAGPKPQGKLASARDATLPPLQPSPLTIAYHIKDIVQEIAAGVKYHAWGFEGTVPGPVLHVKQGDSVHFTLYNDGTSGHSIDFHAARTPWDKNYQTIPPGTSFSFDWTADYPGVFVYHCGTAPMLHHISNGMYGLIVVDPAQPLPPAREYWLLQSEFYASDAGNGTWGPDMNKMLAVRPDLLAFNGAAFQYKDNPLPASKGERIRLYVGNIGPTLFSAFHVVGALFDRVYIDGNPKNVLEGVQTYTIPPGGGSTFELVIPEAGLYPFVTHAFAYTELGAVGLLKVT